MAIKKSKKQIYLILGVAVILLLFLAYKTSIPFFAWNTSFHEENNYKFMNQLRILAKDLRDYKKEHDQYPENLLLVKASDKLCIENNECKKVYYKVSSGQQDFRLTLPTYGSIVLYYDPSKSTTSEELNQLSELEQTKITPNGCHFCFTELKYYKDEKLFDPNIWPKL